MTRYLKLILPLFLLALILLVGAFAAVPRVVGAIPGEYRVRLARIPLVEPILELGMTPLPTALPTPSIDASRPHVSIPALIPATASPSPKPTATELSVGAASTIEKRTELTASPTITPSPTATSTPMPTSTPLPGLVRIEGLKIVPQGFNNCGPANLAMNLNFYGDPTTQNEAAALLKPNREDRNVSPWQIADYVNEHTDLQANVYSGGDLALIKRYVAAGFPIVIEKGYEPSPSEGWLGHYFTIFGYDDGRQELVGMDTFLGPWDSRGRAESYENVENYWQQFNYTFYLVYPTEKEEIVLGLLDPDMVDPIAMWQKAAERAQLAMAAEPDNAFAWFNLGTSLTRLGEITGDESYYQNGATAFDQARILGIPPRIVWYQFRPYIAYMKVGRTQDMIDLADATLSTQGGRNVEESYLYKGHALALQGDTQGAIEAYEQAIRLNEYFYPAQWALDSITGNE